MGTYDPMPADGALGWGSWLRNTITDVDSRILNYELGVPIIPSKEYPAVGDGVHNAGTLATAGTDDAAIVQQALTDEQSGAHAIFLTRKTFRVNSTLNQCTDPAKVATSILGIGGSGLSHNLGGGPVLLWGGTAGGTLLTRRVSGQNIPSGFLFGMNLRGYGSQLATLLAMGSTTTTSAKPDSGSEIEKVWFGQCTGDPIVIDGDGITFTDWNRIRFDACKGYVRIRAVSDTDLDISNVYYDNNNLPAGGTADGFIYIDGTSLGANATVQLSGRNWKLEVQTDLTDVDAGATDPADRRGLVRLGVNTVNRMQHNMVVDKIRSSAATARASYSLVLVTGGTDAAERRQRVNLQGRNWRGFTGTGVDATGDWIPLGGVPVADRYDQIAAAVDGHIPVVDFRPGGAATFADEVPKDYRKTAFRAKGTQAIGAAVTSVTGIAHGLAIQPTADDFRFSFTADPLAAGHCWASAITSTTFTLNVKTAPGGAGTTVAWWIDND